MKIYLATDHAGFTAKEAVKDFLLHEGYDVEDCGAHALVDGDDYPDFVHVAAEKVSEDATAGRAVRAIIFGATGQGEAMVANRYMGVRAAVWYGGDRDVLGATRDHNNANVLSVGARCMSTEEAVRAVSEWLATPFSMDERHVRRIAKLDSHSTSMRTDFDVWNERKKVVSSGADDDTYVHEREVWWVALGKNIGYEQDGKGGDFERPIVVIKNCGKYTAYVIPLSRTRRDVWYRVPVTALGEDGSALINQMRVIDKRRLKERAGLLDQKEFQLLKQKVAALLV